MAKESFVLVSLKEDQSKKLAQVLSNDSCRKILDYLADKEATESEIASKLNVPISTVHYNLQQLMAGGLVLADEFHYSQKGKEVLHYKLANKYIIITPKSTWGIKEKLKSILPVGLIAIGIGFVIQFFSWAKNAGFNAVQGASAPMLREAVSKTADTVSEEATTLAATAAPVAPPVPEPVSMLAYAGVIFIIGALFSIAMYLVWDYVRYRLKK